MRLMEGEHVGPFNLGNPGEFTMLELAEVSILLFKLCYELKSNVAIVFNGSFKKCIGDNDDSGYCI